METPLAEIWFTWRGGTNGGK